MTRAGQRLAAVRALGAGRLDLSHLPAGRLAGLARYGMAAPVGAIRQMTVVRRKATLIATMRHLEVQAGDEVLDVFDQLYATKVEAKAERSAAKERRASFVRLVRAARRLAAGMRVMVRLEPRAEKSVVEAWEDIEDVASFDQLSAALGWSTTWCPRKTPTRREPSARS